MEELNKVVADHYKICNHAVVEDEDYATSTSVMSHRLWYCEHCSFHVSTIEFTDGSIKVRAA